MQAPRVRGNKLLLILDLSTRWVEWSASHPGCTLHLGNDPWYPLDKEAGWASELVYTQKYVFVEK
jgi:hypothetical protein